MQNDIETLIRDAAPRVSREPDAFLAALNVSEEAADSLRRSGGKRWRVGWIVVAATVVALIGTNAAVAAVQGPWPFAAGETDPAPYEATPMPIPTTPVKTVGYTLNVDLAPGVEGFPYSDADGNVLHRAQDWLYEHQFVVDVPEDAQTLADGEDGTLPGQEDLAGYFLEQKAFKACQGAIDDAVAAGGDQQIADLYAYLTEQGLDTSRIVVSKENGIYEAGR